MKLLVVVAPREARDDIEAALQSGGALGFTEIPGVLGEDSSGPRFGSRAAPGISDLILVAVDDGRLASMREALAQVAARKGRRLHGFLIPAEEL